MSTAAHASSGIPPVPGDISFFRAWASAVLSASVFAVTTEAHAIRPFVTDDARVAGQKTLQLETWVVVDRFVVEHNALASFGATDWLELTLGVVHGGVHSGPQRGYSIAGPILQVKALALDAQNNGPPGLAVAAGVLPPLGYGAFTPQAWTGFAYLALTESVLDEWFLFHANLGVSIGDAVDAVSGERRTQALVVAGFGFQARMIAGLHGVAEVFYGDPYDPRFGYPAMQVGFRYIFSDHIQVDGTFGSTLTPVRTGDDHAQTEQWGTLGLRLVSSPLW